MKRNIKKLSIVLTCSFLAASCSKQVMDKINENPNNPQDVSSKFILTDVMTSSAFKVTGSDYAFYASVYTELNAGIFGQMFDAEMRISGPVSASTYNNTWGNQYENLYELKKVIEKCSAAGSEAGNYASLGIAQILTAYNLAMLTDLMGDVPYSEALQSGVIFQPKLDKQQALYDTVFNLLDSAVINLKKTNTSAAAYAIGAQDLIFSGNTAKWLKVAYGLKARYTMRLSLRRPDYQGVVDNALKSYASAADEFKYNYNGGSTVNPFYSFANDRWYFGSSQSLHNKLTERNDPRDKAFFDYDPAVFAPNGNVLENQSAYGGSALLSKTTPTYMQSYHEVLFLLSEAYARLNDKTNAENYLKKAIEVSFVKVGLTVADADSYYTGNIQSKFTANPLQEIMIQKYLSFYGEESIEAYNDYRRLIAMGNDFIKLENPLNGQNKFPWRFTYGADDVSANKNVKAAYGDGSYVYSQQVWWAGGDR